jgi:hypothetical protein
MSLQAGAEFDVYHPGAFATAFLDPYFYIDPTFANASDYSIIVSPGVGNFAAPEPSTWTMVLLGIASLGFARFRPEGREPGRRRARA